jgi:hypothetical protein
VDAFPIRYWGWLISTCDQFDGESRLRCPQFHGNMPPKQP